jgi:hypothetical protein
VLQLTRDALDSVQLMIEYLRRPDLLDADRVAPWTAASAAPGARP